MRLVAGAAQKGLEFATTGSHIILDAGIQAGIAAGPLLTAAGALGPPLVSGGSDLVSGLGHGVVTAVTTVGPPLLSGGSALATNVGHGLVAVVKAGAHVTNEHLRPAVGSLAQGALDHGIPAVRALADGSRYMGSAAFTQLYDIIHNMPEIPSLDVHQGAGQQLQTSHSTVANWTSPVNNAITYGALRDKRRSLSPTPRYIPAKAAAVPAAAEPVGIQTTGTNDRVISHDSVGEWEQVGRGTIANQLMIRSGFHSAVKSPKNGSKRGTAAIIKSLSTNDMIHLLLKLDHKR
jgi:hypothetical protein